MARNTRYANFTPIDNQAIIRARHIERVKRRLNRDSYIIFNPATIAKIGCAPHHFKGIIDTLREEGMLIHSETERWRNRWGELILHRKYILTQVEVEDE